MTFTCLYFLPEVMAKFMTKASPGMLFDAY